MISGQSPLVNYSGSSWDIVYWNNKWDGSTFPVVLDNPTRGSSILLGSGDTAPTLDDYWAETPISTLTTVSQTQNSKTPMQIRSVTRVVRNDTENSIIVRELIYYINVFRGGSITASNYADCAFARKVLETPVIIAPGETYAFTYIIEGGNA